MRHVWRAAAAVTFLAIPGGASAQPAVPAAPQAAAAPAAPNDYAKDDTWLCRPGRHDACDIDLATTIVAASGALVKEAFRANPNAPIDCFYVYPTVSTDTTVNSDMTPDPAERTVIAQQFARFAQACRPFAPMYRQVTLAGLRRGLAGGTITGLDVGVHYNDVRDAWRHYLEHDNRGRGVVLIGHSQGSFILTRLIAEEIDGKPVQSRLVSAILMGATVAVPKGKDVGGAFKTIPLCHTATDTGCLITFASFRSTLPAPANTLFGKVPDESMAAACTNPAALGGGSGDLHAYLDARGQTITTAMPVKPWVSTGAAVDTPFVSVPGLLSAQCATNANATFLEITVKGNPADPRVDDIVGDLGAGQQVLANWGLHLVDVNLAMGNLLDIVSQQARAFGLRK